jgi:transcriptional regulator with XRE-family HTH domain
VAANDGQHPQTTRRTISRWERDSRIPQPAYRRWLAVALDLPLDTLNRAAAVRSEDSASGHVDAMGFGETRRFTAMTPLDTEHQDALRETLWRPAAVDINGAFTIDDEERIILAVRRPMRVDASVVDSLAKVLAAQRRTEDAIGSESLIRPVTAQLATIEHLVADARGSARPQVIDIAAQWAEYAGWLHTSAGHSREARMWFDRASEWATEAGNTTLAATSLSFKGYHAFLLGQIGAMVGLTQAAQRDASVWVGQRAYNAFQEARGLALLADTEAAVGKVNEGTELAAHAGEQIDERPPWIYYYTAPFFALERSLVYRYLGRDNASHNDEAIASLTAALADVGEARSSEWVGEYVCHLAVAYVQAGAPDKACETAMEVMGMARATESVRLLERLRVIHARLVQRWPDDPHVIELGEALRQ